MDSDRVEQLDPAAEVFYRRLMSKVDDYGLYDARPSYLRSTLYPLRADRVREADILRWIATCETAELIALFQVAGKLFLQMLDTKWEARSKPKWPMPPWGTGRPSVTLVKSTTSAPLTDVNRCEQVETVVPVLRSRVSSFVVVGKPLVAPPAASPTDTKPKKNGHHTLGSRLADDWKLPDQWREWTMAAYPDVDAQRVVRMSLEFRDYWIALPGSKGRKTNWLATWRNNVRKKMGDA